MRRLLPRLPAPGRSRRAPRRAATLAGRRAGVLWTLAVSCLVWAAPAAAQQSQFADGEIDVLRGTVFGEGPDLFPEDERMNLLVLALNPLNVTESVTEQIGLILQKNLSNTGDYNVVGPRETDALYEQRRPELVDCREIACGVESAKFLGADRVLVGTLRRAEEGERFHLQLRLIRSVNNLTDYEEQVRFTDENMDEVLFRLANNISDNTLKVGRVLSTSVRGIVIDMGIRDGIQLGDFLIVYKEEVPITDLEGEVIDTQRKTVAVVKVLRVNDATSEALVVHSVEEPQVGQFAATYRDPIRQTQLIEDTRRELDTGIRLANKLRPLELAPVMVADEEKRAWQQRLARAEAERTFWYTVTGVAGAGSLVLFLNFEDTDFARLRLAAVLAATGYGAYRSLQARERVNELQVEGRAKGFLNALRFDLGDDRELTVGLPTRRRGPSLGLAFHF